MVNTMKVMARTPVDIKDLRLNDEKILKKQKKILEEEFMQNLALIIYSLIVILYLYDCSLILLMFRVVQQLILSLVPKETSEVISIPIRKTISQKVLSTLMVTTGISVISHIFFVDNVITDPNDAYSYSATLINFIGERKFSNRFTQFVSLISLDLLLLFLHFVLYSLNYMYKFGLLNSGEEEEPVELEQSREEVPLSVHELSSDNDHIPLTPVESTGDTGESVKEYDGFTGDLTLFGLDLVAIFKKAMSFSRDEQISEYLASREESGTSSGDTNGNGNSNSPFTDTYFSLSAIRANAANIV